jgi:hypothetical protein
MAGVGNVFVYNENYNSKCVGTLMGIDWIGKSGGKYRVMLYTPQRSWSGRKNNKRMHVEPGAEQSGRGSEWESL